MIQKGRASCWFFPVSHMAAAYKAAIVTSTLKRANQVGCSASKVVGKRAMSAKLEATGESLSSKAGRFLFGGL